MIRVDSRDMWRWIAGEAVHGSRSGLLIRIWTQLVEERSRRRKAEARIQAAGLNAPAELPR